MQQLHPRAVWLFFISYLTRFLPFLALIAIFIVANYKEVDRKVSANIDFNIGSLFIFAAIFLILVIFLYIWAKLSHYYYRYEMTEDAFKKEYGVIYKRYTSIPYEKIQNVDIHRGIWDRILGLSDLQIQTAGLSVVVSKSGMMGMGAEGRLPGVDIAAAELLRSELIKRSTDKKINS